MQIRRQRRITIVDNDVRERVRKEQSELNDKIVKLNAFINDNIKFMSVKPIQRRLLKKQLKVMRKYDHILCTRLIHF